MFYILFKYIYLDVIFDLNSQYKRHLDRSKNVHWYRILSQIMSNNWDIHKSFVFNLWKIKTILDWMLQNFSLWLLQLDKLNTRKWICHIWRYMNRRCIHVLIVLFFTVRILIAITIMLQKCMDLLIFFFGNNSQFLYKKNFLRVQFDNIWNH